MGVCTLLHLYSIKVKSSNPEHAAATAESPPGLNKTSESPPGLSAEPESPPDLGTKAEIPPVSVPTPETFRGPPAQAEGYVREIHDANSPMGLTLPYFSLAWTLAALLFMLVRAGRKFPAA